MQNATKLTNKTVSLITVEEDHELQRVDNFLFGKLKSVPKSRIYRMLRSGEVRVNKKRVSASYKLQSGDLIRIPPHWSEDVQPKAKPSISLSTVLRERIIFEDDKILVINKPAGVAAHGGSGINFGVIETLRTMRPDLKNLELVHRLDRETTGCLILAKKRSALRELHELIRSGKVIKKYILLVRGHFEGGKRIVNAPLLKNQLRSGERIVTVNGGGKESVTIFRPLKISSEMSLLEAELKTGRTHQIRVHAAYIGHPIAGDDKYGDKEFNQKMKALGLNRLALHARTISFVWATGEAFDVTAEEKEFANIPLSFEFSVAQ